MNNNRLVNFTISAVVANIVLMAYIFVCKMINIEDGGIYPVWTSLILIVAVVTPLYYYSVIKLLKLDFEEISDFFWGQIVIFFVEVFSGVMFYALTYDDGRTFYSQSHPNVDILLLCLIMYLIGVGACSVFYRIYHIFFGKRKGNIGGTEKNIDKDMKKRPGNEFKKLVRAEIIFLIIDFIFCFLIGSDAAWGAVFFVASIFIFGIPYSIVAVLIFLIRHYIKRKNLDEEGYQQASEDLSPDREEKEDNLGESKLPDEPKLHEQYDLRNAVLENMKRFLLEPANALLFVDDEYHLQAGKNVYHPDLLLYHMNLKCHVAVDLKTDNFKLEYLDRMNTYLETLDRDVKKPDDNPSAGLFLCKNADMEVVEYSLNKGLSQEMAAEYEAKLIDKKILKEKLGELYDRAKEVNSLFNA